jgi:molecular chaperone GrpE
MSDEKKQNQEIETNQGKTNEDENSQIKQEEISEDKKFNDDEKGNDEDKHKKKEKKKKEDLNEEKKLNEEDDDEDYKSKYLRAIADYQNLTRQNTKEKAEFAKFAINEFLQEILPVYDHLKLSIKNLSEEEKKSPWVEGVRHVLKQFKEILSNHGVEEIKTKGEEFDHNLMEALEGEGNIVKKEVMPGYTLNGKVIRAAKVVVGNSNDKQFKNK